MTSKTFTSLYDNYADATRTVRDLEAAKVPAENISLLANNADNSNDPTDPENVEAEEGAATGVSVGTIMGGGAGLLAGLGVLAIPGLGPVVAAGWLVSTLVGAGVGAGVGAVSSSVVDALTDEGVSPDHAHVYAEGVRRGGTLVTARVNENMVDVVDGIMRQHNPVDVNARGTDYRDSGWKEFDATATVYGDEKLKRDMPRNRLDRTT